MHLNSLFVGIALLLITAQPGIADASDPKSDLEFAMTSLTSLGKVKPKFGIGEPVWIKLSLKNIGNEKTVLTKSQKICYNAAKNRG